MAWSNASSHFVPIWWNDRTIYQGFVSTNPVPQVLFYDIPGSESIDDSPKFFYSLTRRPKERTVAVYCPPSVALVIFELPQIFDVSFIFLFFDSYDEKILTRIWTTGSSNSVDDFMEWDSQRQQGFSRFVTGSHSISSAVFTLESVLVLAKAMNFFWTHIVFAEVPQVDPRPLKQISYQALLVLIDLDLRTFQHECSDTHLLTHWKQISRDNSGKVFQSYQFFKSDLNVMWQLFTVFLKSSVQDRTFEKPNRYKGSYLVPLVGTALGSQLSIVLR